jgi:malate permease and related proteins
MLNIIVNVIGPIFIVIGAAMLISRRMNPDPRTLSSFLIYLFSPALVFRGFVTLDLHATSVTAVALLALIVPVIMMGIGLIIIRFQKWTPERKSAFIMCLFMINAANYGIPLNKFAFGDAAEPLALLFYAVQIVPANIMGIYFASKGAVSTKQAVLNVLRVPLTYAALAGLLANPSVGILTVPTPIMRALVDIAADASIPVMLALLGLKLAQTQIRGLMRPVLFASAMRLIIAPLIALPIALLLGLTGLPLKVAIVQSAMPTAVLAGALSTEFGSDSEFTSAVIFVSTLVSVLTLSVLISVMG